MANFNRKSFVAASIVAAVVVDVVAAVEDHLVIVREVEIVVE